MNDKITVEQVNRKEFIKTLDLFLEDLKDEEVDLSGETVEILYKDGKLICLSQESLPKADRRNILSAVYRNGYFCCTFGNFAVSEYGEVTAAETEKVAKNVTEIIEG